MFWIPLAVGAGLGVAKNIEGQAQASAQRKAEAAKTRFSPWTGMVGQAVKSPSLFGDVLQGGAAGAMLGQGLEATGALGGGAAGAQGAGLQASLAEGGTELQMGRAAQPTLGSFQYQNPFKQFNPYGFS